MSNIFLSSPLRPEQVDEISRYTDTTTIHVVGILIDNISSIDHIMYIINAYINQGKKCRFLIGGYIDFALFWAICQTGQPMDFLDDTYAIFDIPSIIKRYKKVKSSDVGITRYYTAIIAYLEESLNITERGLRSLGSKPKLTVQEIATKNTFTIVNECIIRLFNDIRANTKSFMTRDELQSCASIRNSVKTISLPLFSIEV